MTRVEAHEIVRKAICDEMNDKPSHGKYSIDTCDALATAAIEALAGKR